jgi:hypothetical protein
MMPIVLMCNTVYQKTVVLVIAKINNGFAKTTIVQVRGKWYHLGERKKVGNDETDKA